MEASAKIPKVLLAAIGSLLMLAALDQTIVSTALPAIMNDLGGLDKMSWVVTAYLLTSIVVASIYGKLGDIFGRKIVMQFAVIIFLFGSLFSGLANNLLTLIVARAVQGVGGGGLFVLALTLAADLVSPRERGKIQGLFAAVFGTSSIIGPLLGGFFVDNFSWHWIFLINIPICIFAQIIFQFGFKLPHKRKPTNIDYKGAFFLSIALTTFVLIASFSGKEIKIGSSFFYFLLLICFISTWVFVRIEFSADDPLLPMDLFKLNNFSAYVFIGFLSGVVLLSTLTFTPVFLQMAKGYSPTSSGMQILPLTIGIIASTSTCGIVMSKTGKYKLLPTFGSIFLIAGLFWMSRMNAETNGVTIGFILLLIGIGLGPQLSVVTTAVQNTVNINQIGTATAALTMFRQIGSTFGVAFFSAIFVLTIKRSMNFLPTEKIFTSPDGIFSIEPGSLVNLNASQIFAVEKSFSAGIETVFFSLVFVAMLNLITSLFAKEITLRS